MMGDRIDDIGPVGKAVPRPGLGELFGRLIEEGKAFIHAEVLLYRAKFSQKASAAGLLLVAALAAIMLLQGLIVLILIGVVLIIAPSLGMGWSVLLVAVVTAALIAACLLYARSRVAGLLKSEDPS